MGSIGGAVLKGLQGGHGHYFGEEIGILLYRVGFIIRLLLPLSHHPYGHPSNPTRSKDAAKSEADLIR